TRARAVVVIAGQETSRVALTANTITVVGIPEFPATTGLSPGSSTQAIRNRNAYLVSSFNIRDRYILDCLFRRDGSSLFGVDSRYQNYYRVSGAWRVAQDVHLPHLHELPVRGSYRT